VRRTPARRGASTAVNARHNFTPISFPQPFPRRCRRPDHRMRTASWSQLRSGVDLDENGLENRFRAFCSDEGSNPSPSVFSGVFSRVAGLQKKFVIVRLPARPPRVRQRPSTRVLPGRFRSPAVPAKGAPGSLCCGVDGPGCNSWPDPALSPLAGAAASGSVLRSHRCMSHVGARLLERGDGRHGQRPATSEAPSALMRTAMCFLSRRW
jgi:hypothetical protein